MICNFLCLCSDVFSDLRFEDKDLRLKYKDKDLKSEDYDKDKDL